MAPRRKNSAGACCCIYCGMLHHHRLEFDCGRSLSAPRHSQLESALRADRGGAGGFQCCNFCAGRGSNQLFAPARSHAAHLCAGGPHQESSRIFHLRPAQRAFGRLRSRQAPLRAGLHRRILWAHRRDERGGACRLGGEDQRHPGLCDVTRKGVCLSDHAVQGGRLSRIFAGQSSLPVCPAGDDKQAPIISSRT